MPVRRPKSRQTFAPPASGVDDRRQHAAWVMQQIASVYITTALLATIGFLYASVIPLVFAVPNFWVRLLGAFAPSPWNSASLFDVAINILAFVPLGFLWAAAWSSTLPSNRLSGQFVTIALGCLGLAILAEGLQFWIPLRDPSIRDVLILEWGAILGYRLWLAAGHWTTSVLASWIDRLFRLGGPGLFRLRWPALSVAVFALCLVLNCYASAPQLFLLYRFRSTSLQDVAFSLHNAGVTRSRDWQDMLLPAPWQRS